MTIMWLIHFGDISPFICPWVVALHGGLKKNTKEKEEEKEHINGK